MSKRFVEIDESKSETRFNATDSPDLYRESQGDSKDMAAFEGNEKLATQTHVLPA